MAAFYGLREDVRGTGHADKAPQYMQFRRGKRRKWNEQPRRLDLEAYWVFSDNDDLFLETPADLMIPVEDHHSPADVAAALEARYPAAIPGLTRVTRATWYQDLVAVGGVSFPKFFCVWGHEWYGGGDPAELAELAAAHGPIPVEDAGRFRDSVWDHNKGRSRTDDLLNQYGAYLRWHAGRERYEAVYNPSVAGRREDATQTVRESKFIVVSEFCKLGKAIDHHVKTRTSEVTDLNWYTESRPVVMHSLCRAFKAFVQLYGKDACRRVPEFQDFLRLWRKKGAATRADFEGRRGYAYRYRGLFDFFDEQSRKRRPPAAAMGAVKPLVPESDLAAFG